MNNININTRTTNNEHKMETQTITVFLGYIQQLYLFSHK